MPISYGPVCTPVHTLRWELRLEELTLYKQEFGHCNVSKHDSERRDLWLWICVQRRYYALKQKGQSQRMTDDRVEALNKIGFIWNAHEQQWLQRLEELKEYKAYHGDCMVPTGFDSNPQLAKWVDAQRFSYKSLKSGGYSALTKERIDLLEKEGFVWNVNDYKWNLKLEELKDFIEGNGHINVPSRQPLARWIRDQKREYQKMLDNEKSRMNENRAIQLKEIGILS